MRKSFVFLLLISSCSFPCYSQWKPLAIQTPRPSRIVFKVETNQAEDRTRIIYDRSGKTEILDGCAVDCRTVGDFLFLKTLHVLTEEKTRVTFYIYQTPGYRFIREIHLFRKTYDYSKVECGEAFLPHVTYPYGKAIFFVLYEDFKWTTTGKAARVCYGRNLQKERMVPVSDGALALWMTDDLTKTTTVNDGKQAFKHSLPDSRTIWHLDPEYFSCRRFNSASLLFDNRYLCIEGLDDHESTFSYYIVGMKSGRILDVLFSDRKKSKRDLVDHCKNLLSRDFKTSHRP